jgi:hypothetical protein
MNLKRKVTEPQDTGTIENIEYDSGSGAKKTLEVGPALKFVAALTAVVDIHPGDQLFILKTTVGIGYVTLSKTATPPTAVSVPAVDTFPVFGEAYTPVSAADYKKIIGTADTFLYVLRNDNRLKVNA